MNTGRLASAIFLLGLGTLLAAALQSVTFGATPMPVGDAILERAVSETGATNVVSAVLLAYRGLDTLGELTILFVAATAAGLVLQGAATPRDDPPPAGLVLQAGVDLLFPFLLLLGTYIVLHGHLTPGGGFQGGAILAVAFFLPQLARPAARHHPLAMAIVEGLAGAAFIVIGLAALIWGKPFLAPLLGTGEPGELLSGGTLPLLYMAVGLKVGAELGGLLTELLHGETTA